MTIKQLGEDVSPYSRESALTAGGRNLIYRR